MKPSERVRRIEIKSPAETPGFLLGCAPRKTSLRTRANNLQRGRRPFTPPISFLLTMAA
jgi:hypothetical protein